MSKKSLNITDAQGRVLSDIERHGGPQVGVRERAGGAIFRMIGRMERAGWICGRWELTDVGRQALDVYKARVIKRQARLSGTGGVR